MFNYRFIYVYTHVCNTCVTQCVYSTYICAYVYIYTHTQKDTVTKAALFWQNTGKLISGLEQRAHKHSYIYSHLISDKGAKNTLW